MHYGHVVKIAVLFAMVIGLTTAVAHEWSAPEEAAKLSNPLPASDMNISKGKQLYRQYCSSCHGDDMGGLTAEETGLSKATPNLIENLKMHSEGGFFWKIQQGRGDMPAFKEVLVDDEIWSIVTAIKQAAGKK